jgi:hypothetical protein
MTQDDELLISGLESDYDQNSGFLGLLRAGHFDSLALGRFFRLLESIDLGTGEPINRRVVALLWYIPLLMQWQHGRFEADERKALNAATDRVISELERILGLP